MSTGLELMAVDEWIVTTLLADSALQAALGAPDQVWVDTIPDDVTYPYVFAQMTSNSTTQTSDGTIVLATADYIVKGVDRSPGYTRLKPIAFRIHALLHNGRGTVADGSILKCLHQRSVHYPEVTETVHYRHLGGVHRFWVEGA